MSVSPSYAYAIKAPEGEKAPFVVGGERLETFEEVPGLLPPPKAPYRLFVYWVCGRLMVNSELR